MNDLQVEPEHALLVRGRGKEAELVDRKTRSGTFVNGRRIGRCLLCEGDVVSFGGAAFRFVNGQLEPAQPAGPGGLEAEDLTVRTPEGMVILDGVSLDIPPASFVAIVGPSGSGKSTLLNALSGIRPASVGTVRYGDLSVYDSGELLARSFGWVPQTDIVHPFLTPRKELTFAAELRFARSMSKPARAQRVLEVMAQLGIEDRADTPIRDLSGGQRKRVSVAIELLTKPDLLFLDEPTSGLDPGNEKELMRLLRTLADEGRTVVVVTHSTQSLELCDRVAVLARGGRLAYYGPVPEALGYFRKAADVSDLADVFSMLDEDQAIDWAARFLESGAHRLYVADPLADLDPKFVLDAPSRRRISEWGRQLGILIRRSLADIRGDRATVRWLTLQAPAMGALFALLLLGSNRFVVGVREGPYATLACWLLAIGATWIGAFAAVREVVREIPVFRREKFAGLKPGAFIASKAIVLGTIVTIQCLAFGVIALVRQTIPPGGVASRSGAFLSQPYLEILVVIVLAGLAAMALGLLISAIVTSSEQAMPALLLLLAAEVALSIPTLGSPVVGALSNASSAQWATSAIGSTVSLNELRVVQNFISELLEFVVTGVSVAQANPRWNHEAAVWGLEISVLLWMILGPLIGAARVVGSRRRLA